MKQSVVTPLIRRTLTISAAIACLVLAAVFLLRSLSQNTIAFGQKCSGGQCWGFQLKQYAVSKRVVLIFSGSWGLHLQYDLPAMLVERANDDRWLAGDRAIYLNLRLTPISNPSASGSHFEVLYDFQRGELYVTCPLQLWRAPDYLSGNPQKNWLTEDQFQAVVRRIEP